MDLQSEDMEDSQEDDEEELNIEDLLENVDLDDFSDEEEGKMILERKQRKEAGIEEPEQDVKNDIRMKIKVEKVEKLLSKASKSDKLSAKTLSNLVKLFKKVAVQEEEIGFIGP